MFKIIKISLKAVSLNLFVEGEKAAIEHAGFCDLYQSYKKKNAAESGLIEQMR